MAIPNADSLMLAALKALVGGSEIHISKVRNFIAFPHRRKSNNKDIQVGRGRSSMVG